MAESRAETGQSLERKVCLNQQLRICLQRRSWEVGGSAASQGGHDKKLTDGELPLRAL